MVSFQVAAEQRKRQGKPEMWYRNGLCLVSSCCFGAFLFAYAQEKIGGNNNEPTNKSTGRYLEYRSDECTEDRYFAFMYAAIVL
mmetsp:Transcript_5267/g.6639  ORF Transcript_5267/g.6639 Transcript_5267/m.6639 type:complete len:84 (+) Transcript_5267:25-276(+)